MEFIQTIHNELANKHYLAIWVDFIPSDLLLSDIKSRCKTERFLGKRNKNGAAQKNNMALYLT